MSRIFEERRAGFEAKFFHDEEVRFRVLARRDRLFARWAANRLGLTGAAAEALTAATMRIADGPHHDARVVDAIAAALADGRVPSEPAALAAQLHRCEAQARDELLEALPA